MSATLSRCRFFFPLVYGTTTVQVRGALDKLPAFNDRIVLFGVRSPLVVEYEETCFRLGIAISAAVSVNGIPRLVDRSALCDLDAFDARSAAAPFVACAFSPERRKALTEMARSLGLRDAPALIDPNAVLARSVRVGDGSFVNAGVVIGALSLLGDGVLVNRAASLGHHTVLGDNVSIGPGATLAGNVHVGQGAMIGGGTMILPDLRIGAGAVVGAGSLVRQHVPEGVFVAGNPAYERCFDATRSSLNIEDGE